MSGRGLSLTNPGQWAELGIFNRTASGVQVSHEGSLKYSAVYACVRVLAGTLAQLPLILYRRRDDDGRERAADHELYDVLHSRPNPLMTSFNLRMALQGHLALWGNAYAEIEFDQAGRVLHLWPLRPDRMESVDLIDDTLFYTYRLPDNSLTTLTGGRVLHLRFLSPDGIMGYSPVKLYMQGIGLGLAAEEFGARFFGNGARPGGFLSHPGQLSDKALKNLRESFENRHGGLSNALRLAILEEGMEYEAVGIPPEEAQFLETRKFQVTDVARIYGVPPHMIADLDRATFSNIEHQGIEFVVHTMGPWLACWEQGMDTSLLTEAERRQYYTEFLVEGLLRGDSAARAAFYTAMFQMGAYSQNDIRRLENENPIDNGDTYYVPLNMVPSDIAAGGFGDSPDGERLSQPARLAVDDDMVRRLQLLAAWRGQRRIGVDQRLGLPFAIDESDPVAADMRERRAVQAATARRRLQQAQMRVYADVAGRILRREANDVANAARRLLGQRSLAEFDAWLRRFYEDHGDFVIDNMRPVAQAYAEMVVGETQREVGGEVDEERLARFVQAYVAAQASRHVARQEAAIRQLLLDDGPGTGEEDLLAAIEARTEQWREEQPAQSIALEESVRAGNAVAHFSYVLMGVLTLRWVAIGKSCPYCEALNGRTVSITESFLPAGSTLEPDGADGPLTVTRNIAHAPAHGGCDCQIVAG